jgi:signal transduction histidine kinase
VESWASKVAVSGPSLELKLEADVLPIQGDSNRLRQVFGNLLSNSIRSGSGSDRVVVEAAAKDGHVEVVVKDNGRGIHPSFLPHIFDRFRQGRDVPGSLGLGLTIAREFVEQHGGTISAHSDGLGKGATFRVRFPIGV